MWGGGAFRRENRRFRVVRSPLPGRAQFVDLGLFGASLDAWMLISFWESSSDQAREGSLYSARNTILGLSDEFRGWGWRDSALWDFPGPSPDAWLSISDNSSGVKRKGTADC